MQMGAIYTWQTNTCLPIFCFLRAERVTRQRRPLLQQVTSRSKLPDHRWKRSFQLGTFSGDGKASSFPTANKCLFANLLFFASGEGDEATSPSFTTSYASIQASSPSLEMLISAWCVQWGWKSDHFTHGKQMPVCQFFAFCEQRGRRGNVALFYNKLCVDRSFQPIARNAHFSFVRSVGMEKRPLYQRQTNACFPIFYFLRAERATRQRRPLLQQVTHRSKLSAHRWKRSFQLGAFSGDGKATTLPMANKCLFADLLLFVSGEGDEATSPSFTTSYASIEASSPSLETVISAWCVQWGWKSDHFIHGTQMPVCRSFTFFEQRGRRGNIALFYNQLCVDPSFQPIAGNAHFSFVRSVGMQM